MRILRLDLKAFGPFSGTSLDLSGGAPGGLHLVYGPNEAGKSSALRAVRDLLYGFEHRTPDAHRHRNEDLRIGGLLEGPDGTIYVQRLKRRKDSLVDEAGAPFDEARLRKLLGGVDRETFTRSFGLDHAELELHGERMLKGEASVGETLFDAGTGGVDVRRLLETLRSEQEKLYRPRGKQEINRLLDEHAEARRRSQEVWLLPESFEKQTEELDAARAEVTRVSAEVDAARAELYRLRDLKKALPALQRRAECLAEMAALGRVVHVPEAAAERRERAESRAAVARAKALRLEEESERAARKLAEIDVPEALLALGQARIARLADATGRTRKAREDLPRLEANLAALRNEAHTSQRRLGRSEASLSAEELRLSASARAKLRELSTAREKLDERRRSAEQRRADIERELDERRARLARSAELGPRAALERVAQLARSLGDVEGPVAALSARRAALAAEANARLLELVPACSSLAALSSMPVPSPETLERFASAHAALAARTESLAEARRALAARAVDVKAAIQRVHAGGAVPSESELERARAERDDVLHAALDAFGIGAPFDTAIAENVRDHVERADALSDRLRREADRVATLDRALADEALVAGHGVRLAAEQAELDAARSAEDAEYAAAWEGTGIRPLPPGEMRAWAERRTRVLALVGDARTAEAELERAVAQRGLVERAVNDVLGAPAASETLSERVERCAALQAEAVRVANERSELERALDALSARERHETRELERAELALAEWRAAWALAVEPLGADPQILPVAALELLEDLGSLAALCERIEGLERRVNGIRRDEAELAADVVDLARAQGIPFDPSAPDTAADELVRRFRRGESARDEHARITAENAERGALLDTERAAIAEAERELRALGEAVGAQSPAELPALEAKSRRARELETQLALLETTLVDDSGGRSVTALVAEAAGEDAPRLAARLDAVQRELEEREEELERAMARAASLQAGQRRQSDALGAEAAQDEQTLGAALADRVGRYTTLRVATALLERAIERYRVENQAPILKRAGELFPRLTDDGYATVRVGREERGIVAVRDDGSELAPHELSTGTRYQLYLALRLASVERFIAGSEPLPLVLDDVTVHVDDARKSRTFSVLADVAERVQILFFTHHAGDAELARRASRDRAQIHELVRERREEPVARAK
ncbi:MAG TPA: AAA family ATPase [Polyangiaceae bacterium]|nr:AAA family ATPase [Polyangiaceae bacterium]